MHLSPDAAEQCIEDIVAAIRAGTMPDALLLGPNTTPADLAARLARHGFAIDTSTPCMALDLSNLPTAARGGPIETAAVADARAFAQWASIVNRALFGQERFSLERYHEPWSPGHTRLYLAHYEGVPAVTAMTIAEGALITLEFVSTLAEYRQRGLGTAVTLHALARARAEGLRTATLRADAPAVNMYGRLGFVEYCRRVLPGAAGGARAGAARHAGGRDRRVLARRRPPLLRRDS